jgi:hypothetical protein
MSWLFGSGKASDEESVRARRRIEELHRFYQDKLAALQGENESLRQDHAEDMRAKEATVAELTRQKKESDEWAAQLQEKLMHLSQELAYTSLQLQHREQEVLRSARVMVAHDFADGDGRDQREGKVRHRVSDGASSAAAAAAVAASAGAASSNVVAAAADPVALGESQARMRELAEARHARALAALEDRYKGVLEDQKRRHHRALADAAAEREEAVAQAAKQHARETAALQARHEDALRAFHGRLLAGGGVPAQAMAQLISAVPTSLETGSEEGGGGRHARNSSAVAGENAAAIAAAAGGAAAGGGGGVAGGARVDGGGGGVGGNAVAADMQALLRRLERGRDGLVPKMIMRQIILSLVKSTSKAHTQEVLGLAATVLDFSSFERLDVGLSEDGSPPSSSSSSSPSSSSSSVTAGGVSSGSGGGGRRRGGVLRAIFGFGGGDGDGGDGSTTTPTGDDPRATTVSIAAVKALVLAYVHSSTITLLFVSARITHIAQQ